MGDGALGWWGDLEGGIPLVCVCVCDDVDDGSS